MDGPLAASRRPSVVGENQPTDSEPSMNEITTVGLDLAKHVFQVHAVDAGGTGSAQAASAAAIACVLHPKAGHMTASDLCAARQIISCQAGAIHT
jgi:hypothetical protein